MDNVNDFPADSGNDGARAGPLPRAQLPRQPSARKRGRARTSAIAKPSNSMSALNSTAETPDPAYANSLTTTLMPGQLLGDVGQTPRDTQLRLANISALISDVQCPRDTQRIYDTGMGDVHLMNDTQAEFDIAPLIDEIREQWKRRQSWHRMEKSLTTAAKSMCRRLVSIGKELLDKKKQLAEAEKLYKAALGKGKHPLAETAYGAMWPLLDARGHLEPHRAMVEKRLAKLAQQLPVAPWVAGVRGVGIASLAAIVGEAGDLSRYSNPAKLWKRMGMAVMPDGGRQRKIAGLAAIEHGYSPARRSVMWSIGDCIIRAQKRTNGELYQLYIKRKEETLASTRAWTKKHAHNDAKRYIEKRFLRELWKAWRLAKGNETPILAMPAPDLSH